MENPIEIQIFVSSPSDVPKEKAAVEEVCKRINNQLIDAGCGVRYVVKEWKNYFLSAVDNIQEEINIRVGTYDIYFGILHMRFGTPTGSRDPKTGIEYASGTQQEYLTALESWQSIQKPELYFFFKHAKATTNPEETKQLALVQEFRENLKNPIPIKFKKTEGFSKKITDLLYGKALKKCLGKRKDLVKNISELNPEVIRQLTTATVEIPDAYIDRKALHFSTVKDGDVPLLKEESLNLNEIVLKHKKIVVLGDAGSGKTTELINLYKQFKPGESAFVPIFQRLNTYTPEITLENFLPTGWDQIPDNLLLIIWDGLDEIQPQHFNSTVRQITRFSEMHSEIKLVISCRTNFYELPINQSRGTIPGFVPYFIKNLNPFDIKSYLLKRGRESIAKEFIDAIHENNLQDIASKPFFLMLLSDLFEKKHTLSTNKSELYERFIISKVKHDQLHFEGTVELKAQEEEILKLLEKIALAMEILARNYIQEQEILKILSSSEFKLIKYCTAFGKKPGEETVWQFEHNNLQEYLAARALIKLSFDTALKFFSFEPKHIKLIPSWVNTLTFVFSLLNPDHDFFKDLLKWLLQYEREIILKFEKDKIPVGTRNTIFRQIFDYYKKYDVWVTSNKFSNKELAQFGDTAQTINFLLKEITTETSRTNQINAISLLGYLQINHSKLKSEILNAILTNLDKNIGDAEYVRTTLYTLNYTNLADEKTVDILVEKLYQIKNQYVRSGVYSLLKDSSYLEKHIDYLLDGSKIIGSKDEGRESTTLLDEDWNLKRCIENIKSSAGLKKLLSFLRTGGKFKHDSAEITGKIVANCSQAYEEDKSIFEDVLAWFTTEAKRYDRHKTNLIFNFFEATDTREKAFYKVWESYNDRERDRSQFLAYFTTPATLKFVIEKYNSRDFTNKELEQLYFDLRWTGNSNVDQLKEFIDEKTSLKIVIPKSIDYDVIRKQKRKEDFNLLFDNARFKNEIIRVFDDEEQDEFTHDELFDIRKKGNNEIDLEDHYSGVALRLLREFNDPGKIVKKSEVMSWLKKNERVESYRVHLIYEYLLNNSDELEITSEQIVWISKWVNSYLTKINFKTAITVDPDGTIHTKLWAVYAWLFIRRFNIPVSKETYLDMLSFDYFEGHTMVGIDYLQSKLSKNEITSRMLNNLKQGINEFNILKNHINYLTKNSVRESYEYALSALSDTRWKYYDKHNLLKIYYENTKDAEGLKSILDKVDHEIKWEIIETLRKAKKEVAFLKSYLLEILKKGEEEDRIKAAENLLMLQDLTGLQYYIEWIKRTEFNNRDEVSRIKCIARINDISMLHLVIDLLDIGYNKKVTVEPFEDIKSLAIQALTNIALVNEQNYSLVKAAIEAFMLKNEGKYEHVNYLVHNMQRIEEQFYMNAAKSYTIAQAKEKIKLLE
jgi:hypothetical protein